VGCYGINIKVKTWKEYSNIRLKQSLNQSFMKHKSLFTLLLLAIIVFSCKDELITKDMENTDANSEAPVSLKAGAIDLPGRLLASNCFQCHGTNGYAGELKIGEQSASSIISDLNEMKTKDPRSNIMNLHARAYTTEEIKLIAEYISKQIKN
jgi:sulfide dehydrogenase cytochrome subunit